MLSENENVISFCPGSIKNGEVTLGRIVVHDRIKVENEILPRYFNHSSFASLRRQLNYFSFTRIGKGRQKGATYCNEGVIAIEDILRLRRRSATSGSEGSASSGSNRPVATKTVSMPPPKRASLNVVSPRNHKSTKRGIYESPLLQSSQPPMKKIRHGPPGKGKHGILRIDAPSMAPTLVSPMTSPLHTPSTTPTEVSLDLTVPHPQFSMAKTIEATNEPTSTELYSSIPQSYRNHSSYLEDPDILAGCRALLNFSHGLHSLTAA